MILAEFNQKKNKTDVSVEGGFNDKKIIIGLYTKSSKMLFKMFEDKGGLEEAEAYLKAYCKLYKYEELDTEEFVRFTMQYFNLEDDSFFRDWLELE